MAVGSGLMSHTGDSGLPHPLLVEKSPPPTPAAKELSILAVDRRSLPESGSQVNAVETPVYSWHAPSPKWCVRHSHTITWFLGQRKSPLKEKSLNLVTRSFLGLAG